MRCDLHVHSRFSGRCSVPVLRHFVDESYAEPAEVYATARRRGMDLVTLTDHDTIEGALTLVARPDVFVSEEVTCTLPGGRELHLGVYDLSENQHEGVAARRNDADRLFAYLAEKRLPVALNHPFSALTGPRETSDLELAFEHVTHVEGLNGMLPTVTNRCGADAGTWHGLPLVGGSDSHTLRSVARAHTVVPGARTRAEFLAGLRQGFCIPAGRSGGYVRLTADLAVIAARAGATVVARAASGWKQAGQAVALACAAPLLSLLPVMSAIVTMHDRRFAARHLARHAVTLPTSVRRTDVAARGYRAPAASIP